MSMSNTKLGSLVTVLISFLTAGGGGAYWYETRPTVRPVACVRPREDFPPAYREARLLTMNIEREDSTWTAEMKELIRLIEEQNAQEFHLSQELETAAKLQAYVEKLLKLGEATAAQFMKMQGTAHKLDELLKQAPAKYADMANSARTYAAETNRSELKSDYVVLADIWSAKARAVAAHQHDIERYLNSDLLEYLRQRNTFLKRLLMMLSSGLNLEDLRNAGDFAAHLEEVIHGHEFLRRALREWRARLNDPSAPPPPAAEPKPADDVKEEPKPAGAVEAKGEQDRVKSPWPHLELKVDGLWAGLRTRLNGLLNSAEKPPKGGDGAAASPPQLQRVTLSDPAPAAIASSVSDYWQRVGEQERAWEVATKRLIETVEGLRPEEGKPPTGDASPSLDTAACLGPDSTRLDDWRGQSGIVEALRWHADKLIRGGETVEAELVEAKEAAAALIDLLKQRPTADQVLGEPLTDAVLLRVVAALRQGDGREAEARVVEVLVRTDLSDLADLPTSLHERTEKLRAQYNQTHNRFAPVAFTEALRGALDTHVMIRDRLGRSWAKHIVDATRAESSRSARAESPPPPRPASSQPPRPPAAPTGGTPGFEHAWGSYEMPPHRSPQVTGIGRASYPGERGRAPSIVVRRMP